MRPEMRGRHLTAELAQCLDVLARLCPYTCEAHGLEQPDDAEIDAAIRAAATELHGGDTAQWPPVVRAALAQERA